MFYKTKNCAEFPCEVEFYVARRVSEYLSQVNAEIERIAQTKNFLSQEDIESFLQKPFFQKKRFVKISSVAVLSLVLSKDFPVFKKQLWFFLDQNRDVYGRGSMLFPLNGDVLNEWLPRIFP